MTTIQGTFTDTQVVKADGTATVTIRPTSTVIWNVTQVTAEMVPVPASQNVAAGATCNLRKNGFLVTPLVPNGDAAAGDPPIQVLPSDVLTVEWAACTPGHLGKVMAIYDVQEY